MDNWGTGFTDLPDARPTASKHDGYSIAQTSISTSLF